MSSIPLTTGTGATATVNVVPLTGGGFAPAHVIVGPTGGIVTPAQDGTFAPAVALLQALVAALSGTVVIDPGGM